MASLTNSKPAIVSRRNRSHDLAEGKRGERFRNIHEANT
jgi:hypothetical protein